MGLQIIGPGFGRTGTNSMKLALEQLGLGPCHHMFEVRDNADQLPEWQAAARGETVDFNGLLRGYQAQVDWPGAHFWRELVEQNPTARVILTVRDPDDWFDSMQATIAPFIEKRGQHPDPHANAIAEFVYDLVARQVFDGRLSDRAHATGIFRQHIADVQAAIPDDRLLVFDVQAGWEPLCRFLRVETPAAAFPRTNSSRAFNEDEWKVS